MSRYSTRQPFTTTADYVCLRSVKLNGVVYAPGDDIPNGTATHRVMAALYDQRKIDIKIDDAKAPENTAPAAAGTPENAAPEGITASPATDAAQKAADAPCCEISSMKTHKELDGFAAEKNVPLPDGWAEMKVAAKKDVLTAWQAAENMSAPTPAPDAPAEATEATAPAPEAQATEAAQSEPTEPAPTTHRVKQAGLGGFKVIAPNGEVVGQGWPTHAEAVAEAARLDAI